MSEKTNQFLNNPNDASDAESIRAGMTDIELMEAWAETGDTRYLTPATMKRMGMNMDENGEPYFPGAPTNEQFDAGVLQRWGVNVHSLQSSSADIVSKALLPLASRQVTFARTSRKQFFSETDRDAARRELSRFIRERPEEMMAALFVMLDPENLASLEYIRHLEEEAGFTVKIANALRENNDTSSSLFSDTQRILMAFIHESEALKKRLWDDQHGRYLVFQAIQDFCSRMLLSRAVPDDVDKYVPFEISKGTYAAFSLDSDRIFVAEDGQSADIAAAIKQGWTPDYREHGHDAPSYKYEYFSEDLMDEWERVIDNGTLISELFPEEFSKNPNLIHQYALLLHSRFRAIIEEDLGFRLRDLTIREQLYFLEYSKEVAWHGRDSLRAFVANWGIEGLRTFLASTYDSSVAQDIFTFSQASPEVVQRIIHNYVRLIDAAETISNHLSKSEQFKDTVSRTFAQQLFQIAIRRAGHLFKAGAQMQRGDYAGKETLQDLSAAFEGIAHAFTVIEKGLREPHDGRFLSTEAFRLDVEHEGSIYECKILIRPEDAEGKKTGKAEMSRLPARISFEVKLPAGHPLYTHFVPGYELSDSARVVEGKEAARAEKRLNQSTIRIAFDLDEENGKRVCSADFARGDNQLGERGVRSGDVLGRILDTVAPEGHRLTEGLDPRLSDPMQFAIPARALKGLLKQYVEGLIASRQKKSS